MNSGDKNITCFSFTGDIQYSNNTQCPGSGSCCQTAAQCRPDRLCSANNDNNTLIRAACIDRPWSLTSCSQICLYDPITFTLPRVNICQDGSYCCDNQTNTTTNCCLDKLGVFLDQQGNIIGRANQTSTSTIVSSATTSSSSTSSSTSTAHSQSSTHHNLALYIALPICLVIAILICVGSFWFCWRRKQRPTTHGSLPAHEIGTADAYISQDYKTTTKETGYKTGHAVSPQEMPVNDILVELPAEHR